MKNNILLCIKQKVLDKHILIIMDDTLIEIEKRIYLRLKNNNRKSMYLDLVNLIRIRLR